MRFFKTIKFRLTMWYLVTLVVLLFVFGTAAYFMLSHNLHQNLDDSLRTRANELQGSLRVTNSGVEFDERLSELVLIYDANENLMQRLGPNVEFVNIAGIVKQALFGETSFLTAVTTDGQEVRLYATPFTVNSKTRIAVVIGSPLSEISGVLETFRSILGFSALALVILAGIGGMFMTNRTLRPVERITGTAQEIGESDLNRRIDVRSEDELGRLAVTLNRMMERLETAFDRQRQFAADASHELRTPLSIIQAESSLALDKERTAAEYRKALELVSQEVTYMSAILGKLLFLARGDAGKEPMDFKDVNLRELIEGLASDVEVLAREKGLEFNLGTIENLTIKGDRVQLRQLFLNILENAVRYTPCGGSVSISVARNKETAVVTISDTGIGIAPEHLPHIFQRFYRVDKARSRAEGGSGLGLAIAKYIAEAHGGKIDVESQVSKGSIFCVTLPLAREPVLQQRGRELGYR
jgi:heavy metal sensor kinase